MFRQISFKDGLSTIANVLFDTLKVHLGTLMSKYVYLGLITLGEGRTDEDLGADLAARYKRQDSRRWCYI